METATAIEMAMVTEITGTLTSSALSLIAQQVMQKIPHHNSGRCFSLTSQNEESTN
jgi:hypothetical protein